MKKKIGNILLTMAFSVLFLAVNANARSINSAIDWAEDQIGETWNNNGSCNQNHSWSEWCGRFVGCAYGNCKFGFYDAWAGWNNNGSTFGDRNTGANFNNIPRGALVFFGTSLHPNGHIGLCVGDGKMIHAWTDGIRKENISNYSSYYVGWRWPNAWTNDEPFSNPGYRFISDQGISIAWSPANVPCDKASVWSYNETCSAENSHPGICQTAYDELKDIDFWKYSGNDWYTIFFGSISDFQDLCY